MADETATPVDKKAEKLAGQNPAPEAVSAHVRIDVLEGNVENACKDIASLGNALNVQIMTLSNKLASLETNHLDLQKRMSAIEEFLPILGEHFAGRLGGTSEDGAAVFDAFRNADPEAMKAALEKAATAAKSTDKPPQPETQMPDAEDVPDHIKRAREMEAAASADK